MSTISEVSTMRV